MNFVLLSDVHATSRSPIGRRDNVLRTFLRKFKQVLKYADKNDALILQAGDFLEAARDWHLLFRLMTLLKKYPHIKIYTVPGQHDKYMRTDVQKTPTTFGVLLKAGLVHMLDKDPTIFGDTYVYGCGHGEEIPTPEGERNILVIHKNISDTGLYPDHSYIGAKYFLRKYKEWDVVLAGDVHKHFYYKRKESHIVNTGPMMRLKADEYNLTHKPCFYLYRSDKHKLHRVLIKHRPAEIVIDRLHLQNEIFVPTELEDFTIALKDEDSTHIDLFEEIDKELKRRKAGKPVRNILAEVASEDES
jgi:DNA repair exonuclease SbcCD nuclease subunit